MEIDESIVQLGAKLDQWLDANLATLPSLDPVAQRRALLRGYAIVTELDQLKARGLAAIKNLLNRRTTASDQARSASLIQAFAFAAKLADALHDELLDTDGESKVVRLKNAIAAALDDIGSGRSVLAVLLEDPDPGVRASAGAYLLGRDLMPDRVIPVLREIEEKQAGRSAGFNAHWALLDWELKQKKA